jgi:ABC-type Fe3+-siderophore transport system permease subunit
MGEEARQGKRHQGVVFGLIVAGVLLSLTSANAETELSRRRHAACDGTLPLPTSAFVLSFTGVAVGAVALYLLVRWFRGSRQTIVLILFWTAVAAVVSEVFTVVTVLQQSRPITGLCVG